MLDEDDDDSDTEDKEHGLTKFGGMIDSESDDEDEDGDDDEFMFNDEESDDSDALPIAMPVDDVGGGMKDALLTQLYSASDGYAFFETQQKEHNSTLNSRNNRFYN